jgi:cytochrome b6-f complex iron-sulfur subunit
MAEKKKMSVAEILAAARRADTKGGAPVESEPPSAEPEAEAAPPVEEEVVAPVAEAEEALTEEAAPAPVAEEKKPAAAKPGGARPSVAEMLAMARAGKGGGGAAPAPAEKPAPAKPAAAKPAAAAKPTAAAKPAAPKPAGDKTKPTPSPATPPGVAAKPTVKDTASILAAARGGTKPGPMTKAAAAEQVAKQKEIKVTPSKTTVPPMPQKPSSLKPKPKAEDEDRRSFVQLLFGSFLAVGFTSMAAATGLWTLGLARFMFPNILTEPPSKFKVGFPSDFPPGSVEEKFKALFGVWIVNAEVGGTREIFALRTVCTHLGCTPNWLEGEQKFKCPCHGSGFYKDGINFEGPAPRPLERYAIRMADDGQLEVDKSKLFQEELGQWTDPSSFVSV